MKIIDRVIIFSRSSPIDTGCGKVYNLASTDLIHYVLPMTASFALAEQSGPGELHQHHISHETYICIDGEGSFYWGNRAQYPIKTGDVINIPPGTSHALNARAGELVRVLVVSYPQFTQSDLYPMVDPSKKRKEEKPPFLISHAPRYGVLVEHEQVTISRIHIEKPYFASAVQLLFVLQGTGIFKTAHHQTTLSITSYDSMIMERADSIVPQENQFIEAIVVQINPH